MDSDSDSDDSHISATPPRDPIPPPLQRPLPLPESAQPLIASLKKPRSNNKDTLSFTTRPILRPKPSKKPCKQEKDFIPEPLRQEADRNSVSPLDLSNLPFQIHRSGPSFPRVDSSDTLLPGGLCLSKFASFSKTHKENLNFESGSADPTVSVSESNSQAEEGKETCQEYQGISADCVPLAKVSKKHPNVIGSNLFSPLPAKKPKFVNEGNFVKLNLNGRGRKFKFKGKARNFRSSNYSLKSFKKNNRKSTTGSEEKGINLGAECDLAVEMNHKGNKLDIDMREIEEAVLKVREEASDDNLLRLLKLTHGYDSYRDGQLEAIKMILARKSTMLVLPTGAGKSLCYQVPAVVFPGVTLVVSPLVALMIDQIKQLPPVISGAILYSSQTLDEASEVLNAVQEGRVKVLFVSPERFLNSEFLSVFSHTSLISLVVIDEAHCVSEWSHNFRPSYMRLRASLLRVGLKAECILAMTATATTKTLHTVAHALDISPANIIQTAQTRDNLQLSISLSLNKMKDLIALLKSSSFAEVKSIIIYCKFQSETDAISKHLCDNNIPAKSYHSSIPAKDRIRVHDLFCANRIRVVVATVAFGMGLDKKDVGAVIHYNLPESMEEYVQEIGRAGRDGRLSYCHLLFDKLSYFKLRSLTFSDGVDEFSVQKFLCEVFSHSSTTGGKTCSLIKELSARKFDMKEEVMLTILTQLELGEIQYLYLLPQMNITCTLSFHQTSPGQLASKDTVVAAILAKSEMNGGQYVFNIPTVANTIGTQAITLTDHLQPLKLRGEITYELKDQAFCYSIVEAPKDICSVASELTRWLTDVESCKVRKLDAMYDAADFTIKTCNKMEGCRGDQHTPCLQKKILDYFNGHEVDPPDEVTQNSQFLRADIKVFLQSNSHAKFTPRAIARILHGLGSPAFPSAIWSRSHFWGRYMQIDFRVVMSAAKEQLINFVGKDVT